MQNNTSKVSMEKKTSVIACVFGLSFLMFVLLQGPTKSTLSYTAPYFLLLHGYLFYVIF